VALRFASAVALAFPASVSMSVRTTSQAFHGWDAWPNGASHSIAPEDLLTRFVEATELSQDPSDAVPRCAFACYISHLDPTGGSSLYSTIHKI
jgi:hypothetical protein